MGIGHRDNNPEAEVETPSPWLRADRLGKEISQL